MKLTKPIALIGMMGAGKSSFGRKIAKKLNAQFFDLDNEIKIKTGYSPKEIFNYFGKAMLEDTEFAVIQELATKTSAIIATGDSTIDNKKAWDFLKTNTITIWLNIDLKLISVRLKPNEDRPYLSEENDDTLKFITQLYHKRAQKYKQAHVTIHRPILNKKTFLKKLTEMIDKMQANQKIDIEPLFEDELINEKTQKPESTANKKKRFRKFKKKSPKTLDAEHTTRSNSKENNAK